MIVCPYCGSKNLEGADACEDCQHSLTDLSIPKPSTPVERGLMKDRIEAISLQRPITVDIDTPIGQVLEKMVVGRVGCVMVVENDKLCGIFSERDALMKINIEADQFANRPIRTVMTPDPVTLDTKNKIAFALHKMHVGGYRHLPILTDGKLVGVISIRDILRYLNERISVLA